MVAGFCFLLLTSASASVICSQLSAESRTQFLLLRTAEEPHFLSLAEEDLAFAKELHVSCEGRRELEALTRT